MNTPLLSGRTCHHNGNEGIQCDFPKFYYPRGLWKSTPIYRRQYEQNCCLYGIQKLWRCHRFIRSQNERLRQSEFFLPSSLEWKKKTWTAICRAMKDNEVNPKHNRNLGLNPLRILATSVTLIKMEKHNCQTCLYSFVIHISTSCLFLEGFILSPTDEFRSHVNSSLYISVSEY